MRELLLEGFTLDQSSPANNGILLTNPKGYKFAVDLVSSTDNGDVYRLRLSHDQHRPLPTLVKRKEFTSLASATSAPNAVPSITLKGKSTEAKVDWKGPSPILTIVHTSTGQVLHSDLPNRSYSLTSNGIRNYSIINRSDLFLGLGEVSAPVNLYGRTVTLSPTDAASYDSFLTDPLYKHTPYLISCPRTPGSQCNAIYSYNKSDTIIDIGRHIDEPWGTFKKFEVESGGLELFFFSGRLDQISKTLALLVGFPLLPPRWSLGYLASSMGIAESDDPPAQTLLEGFLDKLEQYQIPCSSMHLSSGYTVTKTASGFSRNVFTLNTDRFPDFPGFCRKYHQKGLRVVPNIKPYLISNHPHFEGLAKQEALFFNPDTQKPLKTWIWASGIGDCLEGSWVDTSSRGGYDWWYDGATELIKMGVDGLWNDNDEYSLHDDSYIAKWELPMLSSSPSPKTVGEVGRMAFNELLGHASHQALVDHAKGRRPFVITRSASLDTMQYTCSTWSGDNYTNWKTLKGNVAQTINASISGYHSYGSDIGGFAGPLPSPELFLRWCQINAYHTRFCIHSYKPNKDDPTGQGTVNSPWMYPTILPLIRRVIQRRYELVPYLYALAHESTEHGDPPLTHLAYPPFQNDVIAIEDEILNLGDFWLGVGKLLIAGTFEEGQVSREVYLPTTGKDDKEIYFKLFAPFDTIKAGEKVVIPTPLEYISVFARSGTVIPVGKGCATITSEVDRTTNDGTSLEIKPGLLELDDWRGVEIFPPAGKGDSYSYEWKEDDGESAWPCPVSKIRVEYQGGDEEVTVSAKWAERGFKTLWKTLWVILPVGDVRKVKGAKSEERHHDGRTIYEIEIQV